MKPLRYFFYVFGVVFVAELPDKTAVAALVLATRHRPLAVFLGAGLALTIQSLVAVAAGTAFSLLPARPVHVAAGALFVISGIVMWIHALGDDPPIRDGDAAAGPAASFWRSFAAVFTVIFVAEWGDFTQLATAAMAARSRAPLTVFAGSTLALWAVAGIAAVLGHRASKAFRRDLIQRIAAVLFVAVGAAFIAGKL